MPEKGMDGVGLAMIGVGGLFVYTAVTGNSLIAMATNLVSGKAPMTGISPNQNPLTNPNDPTLGLGMASGSAGPLAGGGGGGGAPGGGKGSYNDQMLQQLWIANGGRSSAAAKAACIALAESSGNASVTSPNPDGGTNVGLWQLDTKGKGAGHTVAQLQNPNTNARLAVIGSRNGTDWSAWATAGRC